MGVPYVSGPEEGPPYSATSRHLAFSENDELEYVHEASRRVLDTLSAVKDDGNGPIASWAGIRLAESVTNLLSARRSFGFDMDCVDDAEVNRCWVSGGGNWIVIISPNHTSFASAPSRELLMMLILLDKKLV
ncbi:hypothetical protein J6590_075300 [Homalodisca vitripennis]|nr:hypothetical protein J6590_075300 [Homalodisca vitripennis]